MHLAFLFAVTIMPFSTRLLVEFITYRTALIVYWLNIVVLGWMLFFCWRRAVSVKLVRDGVRPEVTTAARAGGSSSPRAFTRPAWSCAS